MKKFLVGAVAAAAMVFPMPAGATAYPLGDLNCSGVVTSLDMVLEAHIVAGGTNLFECGQSADLNCDGRLSSVDISIMTYIAAGGAYTPNC